MSGDADEGHSQTQTGRGVRRAGGREGGREGGGGEDRQQR